MKITTPRRAYSVTEFATLLGVGEQTIRDQYKRGELDPWGPIKIGNRLVFPKAIVDRKLPEVAA